MNRKILLVDEWRAVRLLGRRVLASLGFQTREARSGLEALEVFVLEPDIAAVLLDWKPEDEHCLELLKRVQALPRRARPLVIACAESLEKAQIVAALQAGADEFLQKPYGRETLREKLKQLGIAEFDHSGRAEIASSTC
ncbi:MAG TPA: response regulator [Planctomycetaceae bacterium]|nr:response regulator [Planctomycetaceae bacterium]